MQQRRVISIGLLLFSFCFFMSHNSTAGTVIELKRNKVLIDLETTDAVEGEKLFLLNEEGKKKALVSILSIRDGQAVAEIVKGAPVVGMSVLKTAPSSPKTKKKPKKKKYVDPDEENDGGEDEEGSDDDSPPIRKKAGFLGNYVMAAASAGSATVRTTVTGADYFHDFGLTRSMNLRIHAGFFQASGSTSLHGAGSVKFDLSSGRGMIPWVAGGFDMLYSMRGGSSTPLYRYTLTGGLDIPLSAKNYVPLEVVYAGSLNGGSVSYSYIEIRAGYGWTLR